MLHRYTFRNFYSFQDETTVDFRMPKTLRGPGITDGRLSKVMAIVGANGSGKTNLIKALAFLHWLTRDSFHHGPKAHIPFETHFFSEDLTSFFEVEFELSGELWRYTLELTTERVLHEALYRRNPTNYFGYVFKRDWVNGGYAIEQQGFGMAPSEAVKVRENASMISTAAQYNIPIAKSLVTAQVFSNVNQTGRASMGLDRLIVATEMFRKDEQLSTRAVELLRQWDLGLTDVKFEEMNFSDARSGEAFKRLVPFGIHQAGKKKAKQMFMFESSGTQGAYVLLSHILPALATGGVAVIDELEADLHPRMLVPIMDLFLSKETNPHDAQIIFTCHAGEILNLLEKQQVMLVEKDESGRSEAWRLDSVKGVRKDDNRFAKYLAGAYGAVPRI